jgi:hypothetical protein
LIAGTKRLRKESAASSITTRRLFKPSQSRGNNPVERKRNDRSPRGRPGPNLLPTPQSVTRGHASPTPQKMTFH